MSVADANLALVKRLHQGDRPMRELLMELATDDIEWWAAGPPELLPWAGTVRGRDALPRWFETLGGAMRYDQFEPRGYIAQGDEVVMIVDAKGVARATGRPFHSEVVRIFTLRDGKVARVRSYYDTHAYVAALRNDGG